MAHLVLGNLGAGVGGSRANDSGHLHQTGLTRCPETLGTAVNLMATPRIGRVHDNSLQDAVMADVYGAPCQLGFVKLGA